MKALLKLIIGLLVVVVIAVGGAYFYLDSIAKKAVERGGEMALGVPTTLDNIHISLLGGEASLSGLRIANPAGFSAQTFMGLGQGDAAVSLNSLLSDTIVVPRVRLSNIQVNLEQNGQKNNIQPLLARAKSMSGQGQGKKAQPAASSESGKKFIIEYFSLNDVQVNADLKVLGETSKVNMVLPQIELRNLGSDEGGLPMPELIQKVVQAVLSAAQNSSGQFSPALAQLLSGQLNGLDGVKTEVVGKAKAEVEKAVKQLQDKVNLPPDAEKALGEKAGELMKGILGGDKK